MQLFLSHYMNKKILSTTSFVIASWPLLDHHATIGEERLRDELKEYLRVGG